MKTKNATYSNPVAKEVASDRRRFGLRVMKPAKGKGSYNRKNRKHGETA